MVLYSYGFIFCSVEIIKLVLSFGIIEFILNNSEKRVLLKLT